VATLDIRIFGDPVLRQQAREVTEFDVRLRRLADDMLETMRAAAGAGLAANQVGVLKRLFVWEITELEEHGAVVNPVVEETSAEVEESDEGCLSFPGLYYPLERPLRLRVRFQDPHGEEHVREVEGFLARCFLHEIDHLNGILFIDHLAKHDRREALRRMREFREDREEVLPSRPGPGSLLRRPDGAAEASPSLLGRRGGSAL
jgi:peptide deformylase